LNSIEHPHPDIDMTVGDEGIHRRSSQKLLKKALVAHHWDSRLVLKTV